MSLDVVTVVFNYEHENHNPIITQAHLKFPPDYPYNPPSIRFLSKVWHPNVYEVIHILKNPFEEEKTLTLCRMATCVYPSCTPRWTTPSLASCLVKGGIPPRTSAQYSFQW